ncbi:hypothetical protein EIQ02_13485 [Xanthomonas campestris pv. raphani]
MRLRIARLGSQHGSEVAHRRRQPAAPQQRVGALPALIHQPVVLALGRRNIGMPGVVALGRGQQGGRLGECIACQRVAGLCQQVGQRIFAAFQGIGAVRGQGEHPLIQRQCTVGRAVQAALLLRGDGLGHQRIQAGPARLQLPQAQLDRRNLRLRHFQRACQRNPALGRRHIARSQCRTRLHHRGRTGAGQALPRFATVAVQCQCRGKEFARPAAIGSTQLTTCQRRVAALQELLDAAVRPQQIGQRAPEHDDTQQQARGEHQHHAPQRTAAQRRPEARRSGPARKRENAVASVLGAT